MSLINFKLKHPADITPWSSVGWFVLSDGEYWLDLGSTNFYEITDAALKEVGEGTSKFVDYQLARLIEDFSELFEHISEPLPDDFYELARKENTVFDFYSKAHEKIADLDDEVISDDEFYRINKVIEWISDRTLTALHLSSNPTICFFRSKNKISLVWNAEHTLENGAPFWTAGKGNIELDYQKFTANVIDFKERVFSAMETQIQIANSMDWGHIQVDKARRLTEQKERKEEFEKRIKFLLEADKATMTNWDEIRQIRKELDI
jgi:hypothetical protein